MGSCRPRRPKNRGVAKCPPTSVADFVGKTPKYSKLPKCISIPDKLCKKMQKNWKSSFDKGRISHEHGGTIVKKPDGSLDLVNENPGTASDFSPNTTVDPSDTYVGTFHTHPYGKNDGSWDGANTAFSGGDVSTLDDYNEQISIVQSGSNKYVLVQTKESTSPLDDKKVTKEYDKVFDKEYKRLKKQGKTDQQAAKLATEKAVKGFAKKNKYGFYKGTRCSSLSKVN